MDSITRIKNFIHNSFPDWEIVNFSDYEEKIDFRKDWSGLYRINNEEVILIAYTNISITGTDRAKPQLRVFLDEYKKPFYFAKKHQLRFYLFSIFTKEDEMARFLIEKKDNEILLDNNAYVTSIAMALQRALYKIEKLENKVLELEKGEVLK